ncbi:MAG: PSD1 and planctomycete cytochrome C domain-containing protein [Bacteroidota bacterium]
MDFRKGRFLWMCFGILLIAFACNPSTSDTKGFADDIGHGDKAVPDIIDFNFHVKPILSDRCFKCHGPDKNKIEADLSFVDFISATKPLGEHKDHFAIVPHKPEESALIDRTHSNDPGLIMPPPESNLILDEYEKEILQKWIAQGATYKKHWSLLPIQNSKIGANVKEEFIHNEIDKFILSQLEESPLQPSPVAQKEHLIRRLAFTITGLPPTIDEIDKFLQNDSPAAYEEVLDDYLGRPTYGEHMASYWMDLARYADTHGYQDDLERTMWPWRDWVINAYNRNMPYDQFVTYQLAGDLLPNATKEQIIATAFNRNHSITQEGGVIPEEYRTEYVADRTLTFGKAFLGASLECARCHDHKYDPISQKDYYSLFSFFNNVPEKGLIEEYGAIPEPFIEISQQEVTSILTFINNIDSLEKIPLLVMEEMAKPRDTYILDRGLYNKPTQQVTPNTPEEILPFDGYPKNRLGLSQWLFDEKNPLTARVAVNRLWQLCFGKGIVSTADDFGAQGALPTHPKLLDHLAYKFIADNWDVKKMLKYILSSRTFQQSTNSSALALSLDPDNLLYARAPRLRLSAENIRDNALASSGLLVEIVGGPSVKPYQPKGLWKEKTGGGGGSTAEYVIDEGGKRFRRSLYTFWKRTVPPPSMMTFDAVSRDFCMVSRETTSTPLQALVMMNNPEILQASKSLASSALRSYASLEERIIMMFRKATSRMPNRKEVMMMQDYLQKQQTHFVENVNLAESYLDMNLPIDNPEKSEAELAAYTMLANVIYNLDETLTRS